MSLFLSLYHCLTQQFNIELGKSNRHTPTQTQSTTSFRLLWSQFPTNRWKYSRVKFLYLNQKRKHSDFRCSYFGYLLISATLQYPMFRYRRIHTNVHANLFATYPAYEFHSFHANYKYSLCKLQPVPNFVYHVVYTIPLFLLQ